MKNRHLTRIINARIVLEHEVVENGTVLFADDHIVFAGRTDEAPPTAYEAAEGSDHWEGDEAHKDHAVVVDAAGGWVLPGFIDVHVHGGDGADFMDATREAYERITCFHGRNGTTSMLATTMTAPREDITRAIAAVAEFRAGDMPGAALLGVHVEGPFVNTKWRGAQNPAYIVPPQPEWAEAWERDYPGLVKQITLAPEIEGALPFIKWMRERGIVVSSGHTDSTYEQIIEAADHGLNHATHTYNAMTGLHHRKPGTLGAVMTDDRIYAEIIADGHHVHPAAIRILARMKTPDRLIMITDAIAAAGLSDGDYSLGGLAVVVKDGVCRLKDGDSLAGSTLTTIQAFRYLVREVGLSVPAASRCASGNPARQLGIDDRTGTLAAGKQADVLLLSPELELRHVWAQGRKLL